MTQEHDFGGLFFVGPIYVEVGTGAHGDYEASTKNAVFGAVELGGTISARLGYGEIEGYDPALDEEDTFKENSPEMWVELLTRMRDLLARCMILGTMVVVPSELFLDENEQKVLTKVLHSLPEEFFEITPELAIRLLKERAERERKATERLEATVEMMDAQKARDDENITLGEAMKRLVRGTDEVRRIVEGEADAKD